MNAAGNLHGIFHIFLILGRELYLTLFTIAYGGYACDVIIKPGRYAEMPTECQKLTFWH